MEIFCQTPSFSTPKAVQLTLFKSTTMHQAIPGKLHKCKLKAIGVRIHAAHHDLKHPPPNSLPFIFTYIYIGNIGSCIFWHDLASTYIFHAQIGSTKKPLETIRNFKKLYQRILSMLVNPCQPWSSTIIQVPHIVLSRCSLRCSASLGKQKNALPDMQHCDIKWKDVERRWNKQQ